MKQVKKFLYFAILAIAICFRASDSDAWDQVSVRLFAYLEPEILIFSPIFPSEKGNYQAIAYSESFASGRSFTLSESDSLTVDICNDSLTVVIGSYKIVVDSIVINTNRPNKNLAAISGKGETRIYRGNFKIISGRIPILINMIDIEFYLNGVLPSEMQALSPIEALKTQAVVSRSYALANKGKHKTEGYDFCDLTHCQIYQGYRVETAATRRAIEETAGQVMMYENRVVETPFSSNCGGVTASSYELWEMKSPLISVRDDLCARYPHYSWDFEIESRLLWEILHADPRTNPGNFLASVQIIKYGPSGRAIKIQIRGEWERIVSGFIFWAILAKRLKWGKVKSTRFDLRQNRDIFIFHGNGFGHGVGLCQSGAIYRAYRGDSYRQILKYYFPKLCLSSIGVWDSFLKF
ncbi:MAG: hypothetical protein B6244_01080 [Candidatus Cloacimonetes bacterium 4572_55]|nr:MAG: hypothetical protein B6244_01080 [Candidatus Cloacimonetes bacterium 4572_55]